MEIHPQQKIQRYWISKISRENSASIIKYAQHLGLPDTIIESLKNNETYVSVADSIGINQKTLNFSSKKIDDLQGLERIKDIEQIEELSLCDNFIWNIPSHTCSLFTALTILDLSNNCLEKLPDFSALQSLELLVCNDNGIESLIGSNLHKCEKLGWLELNQNRLTRVRLSELPTNLRFLMLEENELDDESKEDLTELELVHSSGLD